MSSPLQTLGAEIAGFLLSAACAGCGEPGHLLCPACRRALTPDPVETRTPRGLPVRAALRFEGTAAHCIRRLKSHGDTFLARPLGAALAAALPVVSVPPAWIVPVPTTRAAYRRRGYRVPELLIRRAHRVPQRVLAVASGRRDQRGLGILDRADNVRGSMRARRAGGGAPVVLVDDVVTTGATLDEAARVLTAAGFEVRAGVALAATPHPARFG